jgi:hypothetical protein
MSLSFRDYPFSNHKNSKLLTDLLTDLAGNAFKLKSAKEMILLVVLNPLIAVCDLKPRQSHPFQMADFRRSYFVHCAGLRIINYAFAGRTCSLPVPH